ncbi:MAG: TOBE domain-containing protein, partial [Propionibacteriaceae bacterium]|nr:TOBE domain-containing protein [Propionibacteriaceae bacterium]
GETATILGQRVPLLTNSATGDVKVLVRPENIRLVADPQGDGEVVVVAFLGALSRVQVRLTDGTLINAQVSVSEAAGLEAGQPVRVELEAVPALAV